MSNDPKEVIDRDAKILHVRNALEREINRALRHAKKIVNGCDLTPPYHPVMKAIKSELRTLCTLEQRVIKATIAGPKVEIPEDEVPF